MSRATSSRFFTGDENNNEGSSDCGVTRGVIGREESF